MAQWVAVPILLPDEIVPGDRLALGVKGLQQGIHPGHTGLDELDRILHVVLASSFLDEQIGLPGILTRIRG